MATFNTDIPINFNTGFEVLQRLTDKNNYGPLNGNSTAFHVPSATLLGQTMDIIGDFVNNGGNVTGTISSIIVYNGFGQPIYSISSLSIDLDELIADLNFSTQIGLGKLFQGDDTMNGSSGKDVMSGFAGSDTIHGLGGNDDIDGGSGGDELHGDAGDDALKGGIGNDKLFGGDGTDTIYGGADNDTIRGGDDSDNLNGNAGDDQIFGEGGDDLMQGGGGKDTLDGGTGIDTASYTEKGGSIQVTLNGATAATVFVDGIAEDTVKNVENINGGFGNDAITGDGLANILFGGAGNDTLRGGGGGDRLNGSFGDDQLFGDDGNDTLIGDFGKDTIDGGAGIDTAIYIGAAPVEATLNGPNAATVFVNGVAEDTLRNVENVTGGSGNDILIGDAFANALSGGGGVDILNGGRGKDMLTGGGAKDMFVFNVKAKPANADHIADFNGDVIAFDNSVFKALKKDGALKAKFFTVGKKAKDKNDFVIFNDKTDEIYYDKDGKGGKAAKLVAVLDNGADLTAGDFLVD